MTSGTGQLILLLLNLSFILNSCGDKSRNNDRLIAQVGDECLYVSNIQGLVASGTSKSDSISIVKAYTNEWINRQLLLQYAKEQATNEDEINEKAEEFKNDLIIAAFEENYLASNLDTQVTSKQINDYYTQNQSAFELVDYVLRAYYIKFEAEETALDRIEKELKACENAGQLKAFDEKYNSIAVNSMNDADTWIYFHDLQKEIPLQVEDKTRFLENTIFLRTGDDEYVYMLRILDYKLKDESSPLTLVTPEIKAMLLRQRSMKLLEALRNDIIKKQSAKATIENYVK